MKKIMNHPDTFVWEMCRGVSFANPDVKLIPKYKIFHKKEINQNKVSLISGGGSGHEPAHVGFIGKGMLDAAVCGDVFASPSQIQVYNALKATASQKGILMIIKNYSGDVMNFKNAAELASDEVKVDYVIVNDDIAVKDSLYTVGRRGVAGTVLVHKIAGAAAERSWSLSEVKSAAQEAIDNTRTVGFALTSCTVPSKGTPTFSLSEGEMEYGVGIHGEPGVGKIKVESADNLAERMVAELVNDLSVAAGEELSVMINGFGATPLQELSILNYAVCEALAKRNISVYRTFVGNYMTSIDMAGASVSIIRMTPRLRMLLDDPCYAPNFRIDGPVSSVQFETAYCLKEANVVSYEMRMPMNEITIKNNQITLEQLMFLVDRMGTFIIQQEIPFCELDSHAGDGDFGMSVAKGFKQLKREWDTIMAGNVHDIGDFLKACSFVIMEHCGGASGPIWGSAFMAAAKVTAGKLSLNVSDVYNMLQAAVKGIQKTGENSFGKGAVVGDKTLIDALIPCTDAWNNETDIIRGFINGAKAAVQGAKETEKIAARMGRAGTVGNRSIGYPDAGAYALGQIFTDLCEHLRG